MKSVEIQNQDPTKKTRLDGMLLCLIYLNHKAQLQRTNSTLLSAVLWREGYDFNGYDVPTVLQSLRDRGYLFYQQRRDSSANRMFLFEIEITAHGRDLVSGIISDPEVSVQ